jgi:pteridine reductase
VPRMDGPSSLAGRLALVTGAGRRLGRVIALELAARGADVVLHHHRSGPEAAESARHIESLGRRAVPFAADLATVEGVDALAEFVTTRYGRLDLLVNSAADYARLPLSDIDAARWDAMMALNLRAPFLLVRALLPLLQASPAGAVVNVADIAALGAWPHHLHYVVSKAGLVAMTRSLAAELAPRVRVNAVAPGTVLPAAWQSEADLERLRRRTPSGRFATPAEVAAAVLFLAVGPDALTGQILAVDGGRSLGGPDPPEWTEAAPPA